MIMIMIKGREHDSNMPAYVLLQYMLM